MCSLIKCVGLKLISAIVIVELFVYVSPLAKDDFTVNDFDVMPMGMNALAFAEHSMCENEQIIWANSAKFWISCLNCLPRLGYRRRSLTPLSLSLLANYGSKEAIDSISSLQIGFQTTDSVFRHCIVTPRRRSHSMSSNGIDIKNNNNGAHISAHNGACRSDNKPRTKPPTVSLRGYSTVRLLIVLDLGIHR